jgi:uncharacterized membrane protein
MKDANHSVKSERNYQIWCKCMELGMQTGCHQLPERSFFFKGFQMPVCARCTGVILGYFIAIPMFIIVGYKNKLSIWGCLIMLIDWSLQQFKIKPSTNKRRFITGMFGGYGIMTIQINLIIKIILKLKQLLK